MQDYMILFLTIPKIVLASSAVDRGFKPWSG